MGHVLFTEPERLIVSNAPGKSIIKLLLDTPYPALREAGLTEDEVQALEDDSEIAAIAVKAIQEAIAQRLSADETKVHLELVTSIIMDTSVLDHVLLDKRERNVLRREKLLTIGDLYSYGRSDLELVRGVGPVMIGHLDQIMAEWRINW